LGPFQLEELKVINTSNESMRKHFVMYGRREERRKKRCITFLEVKEPRVSLDGNQTDSV